MTEVTKTKRRNMTFKVLDEEKRAVVAVPLETGATDTEIANFVADSIEKIKLIRAERESRPVAQKKLLKSKGRTWVLYVRCVEDDTSRALITLYDPTGKEEMGDKIGAAAIDKMYKHFNSRQMLSSIYNKMVEYMNRKKWNLKNIPVARWREVCAQHPLYVCQLSEKERREFEVKAKKTIEKGLDRGQHTLNASPTRRVSSPKKSDETRLVGKRSSVPRLS